MNRCLQPENNILLYQYDSGKRCRYHCLPGTNSNNCHGSSSRGEPDSEWIRTWSLGTCDMLQRSRQNACRPLSGGQNAQTFELGNSPCMLLLPYILVLRCRP